jgi:hypothetical protein
MKPMTDPMIDPMTMNDPIIEKMRTVAGPCGWCGEQVEPGQSTSVCQPLHSECAMRAVLGTADHILRGPHEPGTCAPDDPDLTKRQAALAAVTAFYMKEAGL